MSQPGTGDLEEPSAQLERQEQRLVPAPEGRARHDAAPAGKRGRSWDGYAAVIASFIGALALAVSGYTAYVQRQQLRAQVWPHLELWSSSVRLLLGASNQGTGPARITAMRVTVHGTAVKTWSDVTKAAGYTDEEQLITSSFSKAVLSPGKELTIIQPGDREPSQVKFRELLPGHKHKLAITVCYCSVLDECWVAAIGVGQGDAPSDPSGPCPIGPAERFLD